MAADDQDRSDRLEFLDSVLRALPDGVVVTVDDRIVEVNPAICELTGFGRGELVGAEMPFPFFPPESLDRLERLDREVREHGTGEGETTLQRRDESRFAALLGVGTVDDGSGEATKVITVRDFSRQRDRERRLADLAAKDELTGLLNKRSFLVHLAGEVARAGRHGRSVSLAILDLDGFKRVNDAGGHPAGDRVLAEAAGRLGALVRQGEHLARVGGDEFGWILPDADADGVRAAVERARGAITGEEFRGAGALSISAGICVSDGSLDSNEVYRRADRALYHAKAAGGGGIEIV
jgi:diguanylate cyclase (GGDEF)-like protein/PAS domain S-box-containing protein